MCLNSIVHHVLHKPYIGNQKAEELVHAFYELRGSNLAAQLFVYLVTACGGGTYGSLIYIANHAYDTTCATGVVHTYYLLSSLTTPPYLEY